MLYAGITFEGIIILDSVSMRSWLFFGELQTATITGALACFLISSYKLQKLGQSAFFGALIFMLSGLAWVEVPYQILYSFNTVSNFFFNLSFSGSGSSLLWLLVFSSLCYAFRKNFFIKRNFAFFFAMLLAIFYLNIWFSSGFTQLQVIGKTLEGPNSIFLLNAGYKIPLEIGPALLLK